MQGIGRLGGIGPARPARGRGRAGQDGFRLAPEGGAAAREAAAAGGIAPAGSGLLTLQELGDPAERDARAWRRADDILAELSALQCDMLGGRPADAARLRRLAESGEEGADPDLREVVRSVVLRAQVELLRRGSEEPMAFA
jgi:hypothetical protein